MEDKINQAAHSIIKCMTKLDRLLAITVNEAAKAEKLREVLLQLN